MKDNGQGAASLAVSREGSVLVCTLANPPVNALGNQLRQELQAAVRDAQGDADIVAVVLTGEGRFFSAGADVSEFGQALVEPSLPDLIDGIEKSAKPVIAAINGTCLGGGLELALGCHARIAVRSAMLGFPEVKLGILPGAGGTQRAPRLAGLQAAGAMIIKGAPIDAAHAAKIGLVDAVVDDAAALKEAAIALATGGKALVPTRDRAAPPLDEAATTFLRSSREKAGKSEAAIACCHALEAACMLPFDEGQQKERVLFMQLLQSSQSRALRHLFFAQRKAARIDDVPADTPTRPIGRVGIIGAGTMGGGIAMNFLTNGIPVRLHDVEPASLERGIATIRRNYEASAKRGRFTAQQVEAAMALLTPANDFADLGDCDLVVEAVFENMDIKLDVFARLDAVARQGAILATNTSYLDVNAIARATARPADVVGLHFFSPANIMKLVEVVRADATAKDLLATMMKLARQIGKTPVVAGVCHGFIGNRMLTPRQTQANALLLEGASVQQVDKVHTDFGMPMGPFQMADLAGVDIGWHRDPQRVESIRDALCAMGRMGQKSGAGFYDYDDQRKPTASDETAEVINVFRARAGKAARQIGDEEITVRTLYTMVNEGAQLLEEGIAQRASDIDVVWTSGYGWPATTGGPMFWASEIGLSRIVDGLQAYQQRLPDDFAISRLLLARAAAGEPL